MLFQDSNVPSCSPIAPNFPMAKNIDQQKSQMMNLFSSYDDQYIDQYNQNENESKSSNDDQAVKNSQMNVISSDISPSLPTGNSYVFNDKPNNAESLPSLQMGLMYDDKTAFTSMQSRSDASFPNYNFNVQRTISQSNTDKNNENCDKNLEKSPQNSSDENNTNQAMEPQKSSEDDSKYDSTDDENGIPLGLADPGSQASMDLSKLGQNESKTNSEEKHSTKHKNCRISLSESRLHGKNNSGEFVGRNPSLMTIVEDEDDDDDEEYEYEEDYEEDGENNRETNEDNKSNETAKEIDTQQSQTVQNEKQKCNNYSFISKNFAQQNESQRNLALGITHQIQTSNSTNSISFSHYSKTYTGLYNKIIDLNPTDDDYEYDYDDTNSPISLREASDINKYSHQSGLSGSRTIEDLILEQKKAAIASSSSAIATLAVNAATDSDDDNFKGKRPYRKRSNISLMELIPKERACFTVEDMMRLQNIHFSSNKNKNTTNNSGNSIIKPHKPKYSEEEMMKDQKNSMNHFQNEKVESNKQKKEISSDKADESNS